MSKLYLIFFVILMNMNSAKPIFHKEYDYFKRFKNCNGVHVDDKIYTAKHCNIKKSINIQFDLNYIKMSLCIV